MMSLETREIAGIKTCEFKGENGPQSPAALYGRGTDDPLALHKFKVIEGSEPSYNNWCDVDRLLQTMTHISAAWKLNYGKVPFIAIGGKHGNPCGAAVSYDQPCTTAQKMVQGDKRAIFGGLVMINFPMTGALASIMAETMPSGKATFDGVIAPRFTVESIKMLSRAKGKCRLMANESLELCSDVLDIVPRFRCVRGGFLVQPNYTYVLDFKDPEMQVFGERDEEKEKDLLLAWAIGCTSNSNTITLVHNGMLISNGVGQQDRVGAAELSIKRALDAGHVHELDGCVAYSDSFFPFPDAVEILTRHGVKSIFSTSGSVNDKLIQQLCIDRGVTPYQLPDSKARGFFGH
jgi:phosphoribosylaminoimidazolecarboxamide formyltransferase/IMP cyclohydrolase